jgi:hypothetical protein
MTHLFVHLIEPKHLVTRFPLPRLASAVPVLAYVLLLATGCCVRGDLSEVRSDEVPRVRAPVNWSIGIVEGPTLTSLNPQAECPNPRLSKDNLESPQSSFVADPFLVRERDLWFLFFELFNTASGRGEIGVARSRDLCTWSYKGVALAESFHLSFPYVFKLGGEYYMIPESKKAGDIRLYKSVSFPMRWRFERSLIQGEFSDATPFQWRGRWWIFANRAP